MSLKYVTTVLQNVGLKRLNGNEEGAWFEAGEYDTKETVRMLLRGIRRQLRGMSLKIQPKGKKIYVFAGVKGADKRVPMKEEIMQMNSEFQTLVMEGLSIMGESSPIGPQSSKEVPGWIDSALVNLNDVPAVLREAMGDLRKAKDLIGQGKFSPDTMDATMNAYALSKLLLVVAGRLLGETESLRTGHPGPMRRKNSRLIDLGSSAVGFDLRS